MMNKKIGIVCYPTVGGSGVVATELGMHLSDHDYEIHFISQTMPFRLKRLDPNIFFHEVDVANYPVFKIHLMIYHWPVKSLRSSIVNN